MLRRSWFLVALCAGCGTPSVDEAAAVKDAGTDSVVPVADAEVGDVDVGAPVVAPIADQTVAEDSVLEVPVPVTGAARRVLVEGLPAGAHFDERARFIRFRPDFILGAQKGEVVVADRGVVMISGLLRSTTWSTLVVREPSE